MLKLALKNWVTTAGEPELKLYFSHAFFEIMYFSELNLGLTTLHFSWAHPQVGSEACSGSIPLMWDLDQDHGTWSLETYSLCHFPARPRFHSLFNCPEPLSNHHGSNIWKWPYLNLIFFTERLKGGLILELQVRPEPQSDHLLLKARLNTTLITANVVITAKKCYLIAPISNS